MSDVAEREHDRVEARIGELMGVINGATAELVGVIARVLQDEAWAVAGIRSPEHWVTWQCGVSRARAVNLVVMARRCVELPVCNGLFEAGRLSEDAMAAIARRTPSARDAEIAGLAPLFLHSQLTRWLAALPKPDPPPGPPQRDPRWDVAFGREDGEWWLRARLPEDEGALVEKAITECRSQVFRERHPDEAGGTDRRVRDVCWADGLTRMAESALIGLDGIDNRRPGDRTQVLLHIDLTDPAAPGQLHLGSVVPDPIRRYLACDADVRAMLEANGTLTALSERARTVSDRLRAFIEHRDGGCRYPGCTTTRWLHIHHIVHWEDGGPTETPNLCALCVTHHRALHNGQFSIDGDPGTPAGLTFRDSRGHPIGPPRPRPPTSTRQRPPPYTHPTGERVDWSGFWWETLPGNENN